MFTYVTTIDRCTYVRLSEEIPLIQAHMHAGHLCQLINLFIGKIRATSPVITLHRLHRPGCPRGTITRTSIGHIAGDSGALINTSCYLQHVKLTILACRQPRRR